MSVETRITELQSEGEAAIAAATDTAALEDVRVHFLGRKAELPNLLRGVAELPPEQRGAVGKAANEARKSLEAQLDARAGELAVAELNARLEQDRVDVTLPADPQPAIGRLHLITQTRREIEDVFIGLGFNVAEGPEVENVYYNFDALNHEATHPARAWTDTFYLADDVLLRTHTSPMQIRSMELQKPPIYIIVPGRVYRRDSDVTHTPQFHQIEGLWVAENANFSALKGVLADFMQQFFERDNLPVRFRASFFPFTEPSAEMDIGCVMCRDGCRVCSYTGWLEVLGCGMVHPNVLKHVG